jgi:hypothetical protein
VYLSIYLSGQLIIVPADCICLYIARCSSLGAPRCIYLSIWRKMQLTAISPPYYQSHQAVSIIRWVEQDHHMCQNDFVTVYLLYHGSYTEAEAQAPMGQPIPMLKRCPEVIMNRYGKEVEAYGGYSVKKLCVTHG